MFLIAAVLAAACYGLAAYLSWNFKPAQRWVALAAILLHTVALSDQLVHSGALRIGVNEALSLFSWQSAVLLWVFCWRAPVEVQGIGVYPVAGAAAVWAAWAPSPVSNVSLLDWQVSAHVLLSLLSAGLLTLAAAHAVALAVQDRLLHRHAISPASGRFPPLQTMEQILFQLIGVGFVLLSLTLLSGLWFVHDWLAQHLANKTILSITAWLIFGILLWGRWRHGWRGRTAIRWALTGYAVLILAYFGSKLLLEQVLGTSWD